MSSLDFAGFFALGQPSAGRELGGPIDREVSRSRQRSSKGSRKSGFLVVGRFRLPRLWLHAPSSFLNADDAALKAEEIEAQPVVESKNGNGCDNVM